MVYILDDNRIIRYEEYYAEEGDDKVTIAKFVNSKKMGEIKRKETYINVPNHLFALGPQKTMELYDMDFLPWHKIKRDRIRVGECVSFGGDAILTLIKSGAGFGLEARDGRRYPLKEGQNILGRISGSDICISEETVSRTHARITVTQEEVIIEDLDSHNGTWLAGDPMPDIGRQEATFKKMKLQLESSI